jgi:hypothetical protein
LVEHKRNAFVRHLTKKMLAYALGRELRFPDERTIQLIVEGLQAENQGMKSLIHSIVLSEPFRMRMNPEVTT